VVSPRAACKLLRRLNFPSAQAAAAALVKAALAGGSQDNSTVQVVFLGESLVHLPAYNTHGHRKCRAAERLSGQPAC
jgi:serine/threonine protein phosphatase PrpC